MTTMFFLLLCMSTGCNKKRYNNISWEELTSYFPFHHKLGICKKWRKTYYYVCISESMNNMNSTIIHLNCVCIKTS